MRIPLAVNLESRDGTLDQDALVKNGLVEQRGDSLVVRKRPGLSRVVLGKAGVAQALIPWNGLRTVQDDYLNSGNLGTIGTGSNLSPTSADLQFSFQETASGAATPLLMIKNRMQAWTVNRAGTASAVTYGSTMGSYTYAVTSITRASTVATVTTAEDTGLDVGQSVTIAGASQADYNGAQTVTAVTLGSYTPAADLPITITRSGTTATATCTSGDHGLTSGSSYTISGTSTTESYYTGSKTITTSGGTTFTYTVTTTSPSAITGTWNPSGKAAAVTLSGGNLTAASNPALYAFAGVRGTVGKSTGVWQFEVTIATATGGSYTEIGVATTSQSLTAAMDGTNGVGETLYATAGTKFGVVLDADAEKVSIYRDGVHLSTRTIGSGTYYPYYATNDANGVGAETATINTTGSFTYSYDQPVSPAAGTITVARPAVTVSPTFTYTVGGSPATPATGTITAAVVGGTVHGIVHLNGYFCVMDVLGNIWNSAADDPTTWGALDFVIAQNEPGRGVALTKSQGYLIALKEWSTEYFYDAQNPTGSPFSPVSNGFTNIGCASGDSVASLDDIVFWMSQSRQKGRGVYLMIGTQPQKVSTPDIDRILNADTLGTVHAYCMRLDGHPMYLLTLVDSDVTLVYDMELKIWTQWSSLAGAAILSVSSITLDGDIATVTTTTAHGLSDGDPVQIGDADQAEYNSVFNATYVSSTVFTVKVTGSPATPATGTIVAVRFSESYFKFTKYASFGGYDLLLHESDGYVYSIDPASFVDYTIPINMFVRTAQLDGGTLDRKKAKSIRLACDSVAGNFFLNTQTAMIRWSDDDCATYVAYRPLDTSTNKPEIRRCGAFRSRTFELRAVEDFGIQVSAMELDIGR